MLLDERKKDFTHPGAYESSKLLLNHQSSQSLDLQQGKMLAASRGSRASQIAKIYIEPAFEQSTYSQQSSASKAALASWLRRRDNNGSVGGGSVDYHGSPKHTSAQQNFN